MRMKRMARLAAALSIPVPGLAYGADGRYMDGWGHMMGYGYGGIGMWFLWLIIIGAIVYLIVSQGRRGGGQGTETALDILKKRYARGELTRDQFDSMKKDIEKE